MSTTPTSSRGGRALIVSHGQPSDPEPAEREARALAERVAAHLPGWKVRGATLATDGAIEAALEALTDPPPGGATDEPGSSNTDPVLVYPRFMSDGWFTGEVLPRRLAGSDSRVLTPLGLDEALVDLAARWLHEVADPDPDPSPDGWQVLVAAHGSARGDRPARITRDFADRLAAALPSSAVTCGFLEQAPTVTDAAAALDPDRPSVCLPFFAAAGGHVVDDLPKALDEARFTGRRLDPIGCHPDVPALIAGGLVEAR